MKIETIRLWPDREDVELTTFLTIPDAFMGNQTGRPAVIVCPGGAYLTCPRDGNEGDAVAMTYAVDGYQCFVLEYSVLSRAPEGKCLFPAQLLDLGKAILTIREHAQEWCVDVSRISLIGFSAGAHLCGMFATTWNKGLLASHFNVPAEYFKPLSAILIYGLLDYTEQERFRRSTEITGLPMDLNAHVFGCQDPDEEQQRKYSPVLHLDQDTPPVFMAAAIDDGMVPAKQSLIMASRMQELGLTYELHMFQYGDHGFALGRDFFTPYREDKKRSASAWVPLSKTFLLHQIAEESKEISPFASFRQEGNEQNV